MKLRAEVPVRFRFEIELSWLAPATDFDVVVGAFADGDGLVRDIGNAGQHSTKRVVKGLDLFIESRDAITHRAHLLLLVSGVSALLFQLADFQALGVALRLELLGFGYRAAALGIESAKLVDIQRETARRQSLSDGVQVATELRQVMHLGTGRRHECRRGTQECVRYDRAEIGTHCWPTGFPV